ncbi:MAG: hypothetical protein U0975_12440 [Erythrobacter sp.]|nr:hypothetical protein [Erythrobacter sp.]MDZ4273468.1 hypothetical protein [Erythrobacter sp.]
MIASLILALVQTAPVIVLPKYRAEGQFACVLRDAKNNSFRVSGVIVDYAVANDGENDKIIVSLEAPEKTRLSGTYYGRVDGDIFTFRNWVNHESHFVRADRHANLLLWGNADNDRTISVAARKIAGSGSETENLAGLCDINFRQERIESKK